MNVLGRTRIFRRDYDGRAIYSRAISARVYENGQQTDSWIRTYDDVKFPKGADIPDGTVIVVTDGFESVYKSLSGAVKRRTVIQAFEIEEMAEEGSEETAGVATGGASASWEMVTGEHGDSAVSVSESSSGDVTSE